MEAHMHTLYVSPLSWIQLWSYLMISTDCIEKAMIMYSQEYYFISF